MTLVCLLTQTLGFVEENARKIYLPNMNLINMKGIEIEGEFNEEEEEEVEIEKNN